MMRLMIQSYSDFMRPVSLRVSVGTWNVNGGKHFRSIAFKHEHITDWLLDLPKIIRSTTPGMYFLPFVLNTFLTSSLCILNLLSDFYAHQFFYLCQFV